MIQPTLGRVVWFTPAQHDTMSKGNDGQCAAIVVFVHWTRMVNLAVFDANGNHHAKTSVPLLQDNDIKPPHGHFCEWMPYQKGQAAKYEQLEKEKVS